MNAMTDTLSLEITGSDEGLQAGFAELEGSLFYASLPAKIQYIVYLILDELLSNVVLHGGVENARIAVRLAVVGSLLEIGIEDNAAPFNPWTASPPQESGELEDLTIGGRGIHMIRQVVESKDYEHAEDRNRVTMTVRMPRSDS